MPQFEEPTTTDTPVSATNAESEATLEASDTHGEVAAGSPGKCTKGIPWKIPTVEERLEQRRMMYTDDERKEAWSDTAGKIKTYSDEMVARWNSEMDTLLVYAGLFSAILTAFNVQSYQLLTPDPPDPVLAALQQISSQLNSFSVSSPFVNSTQQVFPAPISPPPPDRSSIWLNVLWFSSLIFSLSAASVGIMVKQWLNEYNTGLSGTSLQTVRLRQYRLNSLVKWHVAEIVAVLPVLLQIALTLFFAGLLVLLFTLNQAVAIVASVLVGALAVFNLYTTLLPTLTKDCCYLSPPANAVASAALAIRLTYRSLVMGLQSTLFKLSLRHHHYIPISFSMCILEASNLVKDHCKKISVLTLRDKELHNVITSGDALDADTVLMAYTTTMDRTHLQRAAAVFSDRPSIPMHFFLSLEAFNAQYVKVGKDSVTQDIPDELWSDGLLAALRSGMTPSPDKEKESGSEWGRIRSRLLFMRPHDATQGNCLISNLSVVLASDPNSRLKNLLYDKLETMRKRQLELQDDTRMLLAALADAEIRKLWIPIETLDEGVCPAGEYFDALWLLLLSVPPTDSTHECAETIRAAALCELDRFADILNSPACRRPDSDHPEWEKRLRPWFDLITGVQRVCQMIYLRGEIAGLVSLKLVEAIDYYCKTRESVEGTGVVRPLSIPAEQRAWIASMEKRFGIP